MIVPAPSIITCAAAGHAPVQECPEGVEQTTEFLAQAPLSDVARKDILELETSPKDYMPGLSPEEKKDRLSRMSYADYLLKVAQVDPAVIPFYQRATDLYWGCGIDAISALDCWGIGLPGFGGLDLPPTATARTTRRTAHSSAPPRWQPP